MVNWLAIVAWISNGEHHISVVLAISEIGVSCVGSNEHSGKSVVRKDSRL